MAQTTLLLNATYEPIRLVPIRRAVLLVLSQRAEVIEESRRGLGVLCQGTATTHPGDQPSNFWVLPKSTALPPVASRRRGPP